MRVRQGELMRYDLKNNKQHTLVQIAEEVVKGRVTLDEVPAIRRTGVEREIKKMQMLKVKEAENEKIRFICEENGLDSELFQTAEEARQADFWLESIFNSSMEKTEIRNEQYKNGNYSRDLSRLFDSIVRCVDEYKRLGGSASKFYDLLSQLPDPDGGLPLLADINASRSIIENHYISKCSTSKTRAKEIAIAITKSVYSTLKINPYLD
jgi:hypothetical protein